MHERSNGLWKTAKQLVTYNKGTGGLGISYQKAEKEHLDAQIMGFSDSDWGQEGLIRKSISGYLFMFSADPITWRSNQQTVLVQSSVEAE